MRRTPGQQRRRAARLVRRREAQRPPAAPVWNSTFAVHVQQSWNESHIQRRLSQLRSFLSGAYGVREIKKRGDALREYLMACAKGASIRRCAYQHVAPAKTITGRDEKTGESFTRTTPARTGDPCGGRLKDRRQRVGGCLVVDLVCVCCGRAAA